jgi:hypothetical protein
MYGRQCHCNPPVPAFLDLFDHVWFVPGWKACQLVQLYAELLHCALQDFGNILT